MRSSCSAEANADHARERKEASRVGESNKIGKPTGGADHARVKGRADKTTTAEETIAAPADRAHEKAGPGKAGMKKSTIVADIGSATEADQETWKVTKEDWRALQRHRQKWRCAATTKAAVVTKVRTATSSTLKETWVKQWKR